jgi:disulfide oxidoreductase YuzD
MFQRVHIQVLDGPTAGILCEDIPTTEIAGTNKILTEELSQEMKTSFPSVVYVEYVDLFFDDGEEEFEDIRELLRMGALITPVVLINGVLKVHGGIPSSVITREVDKLLSSGPIH